MSFQKQVESSHYRSRGYMTKARWSSLWHQLDEIVRLKPDSVLEVGPGLGLLKQAARAFGVSVETLDIDPDLEPDHVASATEMPFDDGAFDVVCAFQMLEHLPYDMSLMAFREMSRVAKRAVIISLPDAQKKWRITIVLPKIGERHLLFWVPFVKAKKHKFDGEHYWEVNKAGFNLKKIINDLNGIRSYRKSFNVPEYPYHKFLIFS